MKPRTRPPRFQRRWRAAYWWGFGVSACLAFYAVLGLLSAAAPLTGAVAIILGSTALLLGGLMATRLSRAGIDDMWFVKGTTTVRTVAIGWLALAVSGVTGGVVSVLADIEFELIDTAGGILGTIGTVAMVAVVGPGYSEYREALASVPPAA